MNKNELLAAIKGKPLPYTTSLGLKVDLRPLTVPERLAIFAWFDESKDVPGIGTKLKAKYVSLGLCNADGDAVFSEDEVQSLPMPAADYDEIADEVARRAGMMAEKEQGKALPATPS